MHQPTCCPGGICVDPCAEGNPCCCFGNGRGWCRQSFRFYDTNKNIHDENDDDDENAHDDDDDTRSYDGVILRKPKSFTTELFTDAQAFELQFPKYSTPDIKGLFLGISIFINTEFYESSD